MAASSNNLELALRIKAAVDGLQSLDQLSTQIDGLAGDSSKFRAEASKLSTELQSLAQQQGVIDTFQAASRAAEAAATDLASLTQQSNENSSTQAALQRSVEASSQALGLARGQVTQLSSELSRNQIAAKEAEAKYLDLRTAAQAAGRGNEELKTQVAGAKAEFNAVKASVAEVSSALKDVEQAERELTRAVEEDEAALKKQGDASQKLALDINRAEVAQKSSADALVQAGKALDYAGINSADLAAEQQRVTREMVAASASAKELAESVGLQSGEAKSAAAAFERLGVTSTASLREAASQARTAFETIKSSGTSTVGDVDRAFEALARAELQAADAAGAAQREITAGMLKAQAATNAQRQSVDQLNTELKESGKRATEFNQNFKTVVASLAAFAGIQLGGQLVKDLVGLADQAKNISSRLLIATGASEQFQQAQKDVLDIALQTGSSLESTANLYGRLALAIKSTGGNIGDASIATRAITEAFVISGASAEASAAAIVQFAQGLASGTLRGDELNSVLEQAPRLSQAFADALGITTGELRQLGQEGALTPQILLDALKDQAPKIAAEFDKIPATVGRAVTNLGTALITAVGSIDATTGQSTKLGQAINDLANKLIAFGNDAGIQASFESLGDMVAGGFEGIAAAYTALEVVLTGAAAAVAQAASLIALALSKVTFGDTSRAFTEAADVLQTRASELADSVVDSTDKLGQHLVGIGENTTSSLGHAAEAVAKFGDQAPKATASADDAGTAISGMGDKADGTGVKLGNLGKQTVSVADELSKAAGVLKSDIGLLTDGISDEAQKAADALAKLLNDASLTSDGVHIAIDGAIDSAKTIQDLDLIRGEIETAYGSGKLSIEAMHSAVDRVTNAQQQLAEVGGLTGEKLAASAQALGVNLDVLGNRISKAGKDAINAFADIAESGVVPVKKMGDVIASTLEKLSSKKEFQEFELALTKAFAAGQVSSTAYYEAIVRCKEQEKLLAAEAEATQSSAQKGQAELAAAYDVRVAKEAEAAAATTQSTANQIDAMSQFREAVGGAETIGALETLRQQINKTFAEGKLGAEDYAGLLKQIKQQSESVSQVYSSQFLEIRNGYAQIGEAALKLYDQLLQQSIQPGLPFEVFMDRYAKSVASLDTLFGDQKRRAEELTAALSTSNRQLGLTIYQAKAAANSMQYLDAQTLDNLTSSIAAAQSRLDSLRASAQQTFQSLQDQLDQLNNNEAAIQKRQNDRQVAEIKAQIEEAKSLGDQQAVRTLNDSLKLLEQIGQIKASQSASKPQTQTTAPAASSAAPATRKVEVTLKLGGEQFTGTYDEGVADALLAKIAADQSISTY